MVLKSEFHHPLTPCAKTLFIRIAVGVLPLAATATLHGSETPDNLRAGQTHALSSGDQTDPQEVQPVDNPEQTKPSEPRTSPYFDIWTMDANGKNSKWLAYVPGYHIINSPEVSPDGKFVAVDGWKKGENLRDARVLIVDIENRTVDNWAKGAMPTWSTDGKWIAFCRYGDERGVYIRSLNGTAERLLDREGWGIQWSPDGLKAAYSRRGKLVVHDFIGDTEQEITPGDWDYEYVYWNPTWSPDSKEICFKARRKDGHAEFAIVSVESKTAKVRRRINAKNFLEDIAWHPDGSRIVIPGKPVDGAPAQLYEFNPHLDGEPVPVVGQPQDRNQGGICWSRSGKTLFFISRR